MSTFLYDSTQTPTPLLMYVILSAYPRVCLQAMTVDSSVILCERVGPLPHRFRFLHARACASGACLSISKAQAFVAYLSITVLGAGGSHDGNGRFLDTMAGVLGLTYNTAVSSSRVCCGAFVPPR